MARVQSNLSLFLLEYHLYMYFHMLLCMYHSRQVLYRLFSYKKIQAFFTMKKKYIITVIIVMIKSDNSKSI